MSTALIEQVWEYSKLNTKLLSDEIVSNTKLIKENQKILVNLIELIELSQSQDERIKELEEKINLIQGK